VTFEIVLSLQVFKRLHLGTVSFAADSMDEVHAYIK